MLKPHLLNPHLKERIYEKWNNCWPVSDLRPLALLDLISYLFFIKKLDDWELIHQRVKAAGTDNFIYTKEIEEFTWSKLQKLNAREIQQLFNKEHGVIDLMNNYARLNSLYSDFFMAPLMIEPTPKLIFNSIEIVNLIETSDKASQEAIIEYLFSKLKITAESSQEFLPEFISKLLVEIAEPEDKDVILDPCAGIGSLLVNAYRHEIKGDKDKIPFSSNKFFESNVSGIESNLVQLRIAAMNMFLHGIKNPKIRMKPFGTESLKEYPTLIISSLLISNETMPSKETPPEGSKLEKENELLSEILENLKPGSRAVILVPQMLLKSENHSIQKTRKNIIDHFNLEAVITLAPKTDSIFSGAGILVFNKSESATTEDLWFCKWGTGKNKKRNKEESNIGNENGDLDFNEVTDIINKWKYRKDNPTDPSHRSFFIPVNYIKTNNYSLSFNDYKLIRQESWDDETETVLTAKKENLHDFFETSELLPEKKRRRKLVPVLLVLLILISGAAAFYWFYLKDNSQRFFSKVKIADSASKISISNSSKEPETDAATIADKATINNDPEEKITEPATIPKPINETTTKTGEGATKYTVINKAWFHSGPDPNKLKPVFLKPRKDVVLTPQAEENGFVYIVYTNSKGQTTHGWLNKKNLEAVE
ncbi:MAG: N-6 DNA methylase [Bacteroidota bacterium]|nr:N-6 DNA methylase [Bacteroidota bacterium]